MRPWFTIADFNKGYWMVELDPESRKYTTMALDIGRFQWTRLPMGSILAQDMFQRKLDAIFIRIPRTKTKDQEHDAHLVNFLEVCRKKHIDSESRQDAVQTSTSFLLWTPMECKGSQP